MKYCEDYAALLDPYIDGELSPEDTARVREHLHQCDGCRAYVQSALLMRDAFPQIEDTLTPVLKWTTIFLFCIVPIIGWVISLLSMHFYSLDMKTMKEIAKKLGDTEGEKKK